MADYRFQMRLQVFLQPAGVVVDHATCDEKVSGPHAEHHGSVEASRVVVVRHLHAGGAEPRHVYEAVVPEDVVLAGLDVGFGQRAQVRVRDQQGRRSGVVQGPRQSVQSRVPHLHHAWGAVLVFPVVLLRQEDGPVDEFEQLGRVGVVVGVDHHGLQEGLVAGEVLAPEAHHERVGEDGHVPILLVGRGAEVQGLECGVNESLGLQLELLIGLL